MKHELKILPKYFNRVLDGSKTFEVRNNDRDFQAGDTVLLQEYDPQLEGGARYTGRDLSFTIGYVFPFEDSHQVVFSLLTRGNNE